MTLPDNNSVIILLIFVLGIVFISEVFSEKKIQIALYNQRQNELFSGTEYDIKIDSKDLSHISKETLPQNFHEVSIRYQNGRLKENGGIYRDQNGKNIRHGKWFFWDENGNKKAEEHYRNGKPVGTWIYWDKKGKVIEVISY